MLRASNTLLDIYTKRRYILHVEASSSMTKYDNERDSIRSTIRSALLDSSRDRFYPISRHIDLCHFSCPGGSLSSALVCVEPTFPADIDPLFRARASTSPSHFASFPLLTPLPLSQGNESNQAWRQNTPPGETPTSDHPPQVSTATTTPRETMATP